MIHISYDKIIEECVYNITLKKLEIFNSCYYYYYEANNKTHLVFFNEKFGYYQWNTRYIYKSFGKVYPEEFWCTINLEKIIKGIEKILNGI